MDLKEMLSQEIADNGRENSYRRGYQQGYYLALCDVQEYGFAKAEIHFSEKITNWRFKKFPKKLENVENVYLSPKYWPPELRRNEKTKTVQNEAKTEK